MRFNHLLLIFSITILFGCGNKPEDVLSNKIRVTFSDKKNALVVANINDGIINSIKQDLKTDSSLINSLAVFVKTNDEDLQDLEKPLIGIYQINKNDIVFIPNSPFMKGKSYLVEIYLSDSSGEVSNYLNSGNSVLQNNTITKVVTF